MNMFIDRKLAENKYKEMLQEAAEARADRKSGTQNSHKRPGNQKFMLTVITATPVVFWAAWALLAAR